MKLRRKIMKILLFTKYPDGTQKCLYDRSQLKCEFGLERLHWNSETLNFELK